MTRIGRAEHRIQRANRHLRHELDRYDTLLRHWQEHHRTDEETHP